MKVEIRDVLQGQLDLYVGAKERVPGVPIMFFKTWHEEIGPSVGYRVWEKWTAILS